MSKDTIEHYNADQKRLVDIVICTFNRTRLLELCLDALLPQFRLEHIAHAGLIIVDNNCTDDTAEIVAQFKRHHHFIRYVTEPKQGLSNARNCGMENSDAEYICYLDDDSKPGESYLDNLIETLDRYRPDFVGGPILPYYLDAKPTWFRDDFEIRRHTSMNGFVDCPISGGNFIVLRSILKELGGFSPDLGMIGNTVRLGEERELVEKYRAQREDADRKIYYSQELFIYHYVPPSKMTVKYMSKRAYQSGKMSVIVKRETVRSLPWLSAKMFRETCALAKLYATKGTVEQKVDKFRKMSQLFGKIVQLSIDFLSGIRRSKLNYG